MNSQYNDYSKKQINHSRSLTNYWLKNIIVTWSVEMTQNKQVKGGIRPCKVLSHTTLKMHGIFLFIYYRLL